MVNVLPRIPDGYIWETQKNDFQKQRDITQYLIISWGICGNDDIPTMGFHDVQ